MGKNYGLLLTALILASILLLLVILLENRELEPAYKGCSEAAAEEGRASGEGTGIPEKTLPGEVLAVEDQVLLPSFPISLKYDKYLTAYTYFFVGNGTVNIRSGPSRSDTIIRKAYYGEKLDYFETVFIAGEGGMTEKWYHVTWKESGELLFGFVESSVVTERYYQFDKMEEAVLKAEEYAAEGKLTYISNYQNRNGYAPLYNGGTVDGEGNSRSQSAPGYLSLTDKANFIYIGDGTLVRYFFSDGELARIEVVATGKRYYVPLKYIPSSHKIHELKKVIAIDVTNQNEAVYEKIQGVWTLISFTQATTGTIGKYSQPTPAGFFFGIESRMQFRYYEDGTTKFQGYAPYAIRFAGGAYVHGVPVNYKYGSDGQRITPPIQEYSRTIGTIPLSHKCVRNYTSHAEFLYNWFTPGETVIIVID